MIDVVAFAERTHLASTALAHTTDDKLLNRTRKNIPSGNFLVRMHVARLDSLQPSMVSRST